MSVSFNTVQIIRFDGSCLFHIKDSLKHELFHWPETLLTYRVDFAGSDALPQELALFDLRTEPQRQVPFQLSDVKLDDAGKLLSADVSLLTDLGTGEERRFELRKAEPLQFGLAVRQTKAVDSLWLDNGVFSVRIPVSQIYPVHIPGPVMQIVTNGMTYGNSQLDPGKLQLLEIATECVEAGSLFAVYTVQYRFDGGKTYEAKLKFVKHMEFIELTETTDGVLENDEAVFKLYWSGLAPTHRHAPNNPSKMIGGYETSYEEFNWCRIDEAHTGGYSHPFGMYSNKEDGQIPFRLSLYEPQAACVKVTSAAFWNEHSGQSVGAFILDEAKWDNGRYDLFCSWDGFAVSFYYKHGLMWWNYPIVSGTRTTAITVYEHKKDKEYFDSVRQEKDLDADLLKGGTNANLHSSSYCMYLQNRHSLLSLNAIKDYVLDYPEEAARPGGIFDECPFDDYESFERFMMSYILVSKLPTHGGRENAGFNLVPYRRMTRFAAAYNRFKDEMPQDTRKRIEAMLLLLTYLAASEHVVPLLHMLGGPPNLHGDVKRSLGYVAVLFPEHPEAERWKQLFAKFVETSLRMYTRPDLKALRLEGGRWAENISTYTWAFLVPALHTAMLLEKHGGQRNVFASQYAAMLGRWLTHCMTAPFDGENELTMNLIKDSNHHWGCFAEGMGPHRVYMPIGAHAARRTTPSSMREFAMRLERYDPIVAENIHYVCSDFPDDFETRSKRQGEEREKGQPKGISGKDRLIRGTRPQFRSTAFTGFGIMLRTGVYTPQETSVFLQQIDEGPNYRWGTPGAGGNGNIYYYSGGRAYSHNGKEDAGDRRINDCEVGCNFGVWKNGKYTSIGQNVITSGYHALGTFQFGSIEPEKDDKSYSYPEYVERNVLLSGTDYISIFDKTGTSAIPHRFVWSVGSFDRMPAIHMISGYDYSSTFSTQGKASSTDSVWYEGRGSGFAVVSHRDDLTVKKMRYGAVVSAAEFCDTLFRSAEKLNGLFDGMEFEGTAAVVREYASAEGIAADRFEMALIAGYRLGANGVLLRSENGLTGISLSRSEDGELKGFVSSLRVDRIAVSLGGGSDFDLYIDSSLVLPDEDGMYAIGSGQYTLELARKQEQPTPAKPVIRHIVQGDGSCEVVFDAAGGADLYQLQISSDYCESWSTVKEAAETSCLLDGLENGRKYFIRVCGVNTRGCGEYSHEYPVYPSTDKPLPPEGLDVVIDGGQLHYTWGRVLGAAGYRLYRRDSQGQLLQIYSGEEPSFSCERGGDVCSYSVSSVNLCGEGEPSAFGVDDDPTTLHNYKPGIDRHFNRNSLYNHHPFKARNTHKFREVPSEYPKSVR
jgi:hypothetical protein